VEALRAAGYQVKSVWDLVNATAPYPGAVPVLLQHLSRRYPAPIRERIARALGVREALFARAALMLAYRCEQDSRVKDGLAIAVAATADIDDIIALLRDWDQGPSRLLLLSRLETWRDPRARVVLTELATDPDLKLEIPPMLRRMKRRTKQK
jgi:hypothetical protein